MPNAQETLLEVSPQIQELELGNSVEIEITTDADDYLIATDNQNISFNETTKNVDTNTNLTLFKTEITANIEGDTHITISATAQNKTEKIIEWDLKITPEQQVIQPTEPIQPTPNIPNFTYPLKVELGKQYITKNHNIVIIKSLIQDTLLKSGERRDVFIGIVYDEFLYKNTSFFLEDGTEVYKEYENSPYQISKAQDDIIEYDNKYIQVFDNFIAYIDYAVESKVDATGKTTNLSRNTIKTIEINEDSFSLLINGELQLNLLNEAKLNQVCKFLGIKYVYTI